MVLLGGLLALGCASGPSPEPTSNPKSDADVITAAELGTDPNRPTVYDAVRQLRPAWMMRSRPTALTARQQAVLVVYLDGRRFGDFESLRQLSTSGVASVRYYSPSNAEARFGPGHLLGAIEVRTESH